METDPRVALSAIGQLEDDEIDIADAALQLGRVDAPEVDVETARAHLSEIAREAAALLAGVGTAAAAVKALAGLLAGEHGYRGDSETYEDLANANLLRVIERRRGLPVTLGILWLHAARAAGWTSFGIDFPGHFMVGLDGARGLAVLDPFSGGSSVDARELRRKAEPEGGGRLGAGVLAPMTTRAVLLRLQNNILLRRLRQDDLAGALACAGDMLRIAPEAAQARAAMSALRARLH